MALTISRRELLGAAPAAAALAASPPDPSGDLFELARQPVRVQIQGREARDVTLPAALEPLRIRQAVRDLGGGVVERAVEVDASADCVFNIELPYAFPKATAFYSWRGEEKSAVDLAQDGGEPGRPAARTQLFPFAAAVENGALIGLLGDCPGFWENRSGQSIDPAAHRIVLRTGDGSAEREIRAIAGDSSDLYRGGIDGWQHIRPGQTRRFETWLTAARAGDLYDVRLAAHRALARARGWDASDLTAIFKNTAYLLVRRNLLRPESRYIVISGITYGWKQWVSDGVMAALGIEDPEILAEAVRGVFWSRCAYEDNAQWCLIASALVKRSGFRPDIALARRCLEFLRDHEKEGAYIPPGGAAAKEPLGWKSYMDLFYYEDGDSPVSNQGFHCGALMGAAELGLGATDADIARACSAYARMFNRGGGYFPTSAQRQEVFGGDALYGEAVTFAAFGRKSLADDLVLRHCRHAVKIMSPYGVRVVSKADGSLLEADQYGPGNPHGLPPEKAGAYVQGGSWLFCDAGTWLSGLAHGFDAKLVDELLIKRIGHELARKPAFAEDVNTRTGEAHGNELYSANSLYPWLRRNVRARLGMTGPDRVEQAFRRLRM
jgi:hypothetical protein